MELEVTWKMSLKIWWAYFWRTILGTLALVVVLFICNYFVNIVAVFLKLPPVFITIILGIITFTFSIAVSLIVVKQILNKNYGSFRLSVVPNESNSK